MTVKLVKLMSKLLQIMIHNQLFISVDKQYCQSYRELLGDQKLFDKSRKVILEDDYILLPIKQEPDKLLESDLKNICEYKISIKNTKSVEKKSTDLKELLKTRIIDLYPDCDVTEVPDSWEYYGDLLLLPGSAFNSQSWTEILPEILTIICDVFKVRRVARKKTIVNDDFRSPKTDMLLGCDPWVWRKENSITYHFDITKSMFSIGNISEKLRVSKFDCSGETVVDLFAGETSNIQ